MSGIFGGLPKVTEGFKFQHGGYVGENVRGVGMNSGKSYEFHPHEYIMPTGKFGVGSSPNIDINVVNNLGIEADVQQSTQWKNPNTMVTDIILNEKINSRSFRNGLRRFQFYLCGWGLR